MRPTTYTEEMLAKAREYLEVYDSVLEELVPTVVGLCDYIERSKTTVYRWAQEEGKDEFRDILGAIEQKQEKALVKGGLSGQFNSVITKMMMTKHGYSDKQEIDHRSADGSMTPKPTTIELVAPKDDES
jgi:hypothetical protein